MSDAKAALTVGQALCEVMQEVQSISKDRRVTEGPARFSFRGVDDVMQAVGPALRKHGVIFAPSRVVSVEHERYTTAKGSLMDGVTAIVEYTITGPDGSSLTAAAAGQAADTGDKAVPKAMSVAFRTVLLQTLCIPTDEPDPDSQVHERAVAAPRQPSRDWKAEAAKAADTDGLRAVWRQAVAAGDMTEELAAHLTGLIDGMKPPVAPPEDDPWQTPVLPDAEGASV